jgi:hypothetical protein
MVATCHFRRDCGSGARRIPRCAASHGPARHADGGVCACAGLSTTRDGDTPGGSSVCAGLVRVSIARAASPGTAVIHAGTPHVASPGTAVIRAGTPQVASPGTAVTRAGTPHVGPRGFSLRGSPCIACDAPTGTPVTRNNITRADTSRAALIRATGTCRCIQVRRYTFRSIADPSPSCAKKCDGPAERPNCERPCRNHHASSGACAACRLCAYYADSTRIKP